MVRPEIERDLNPLTRTCLPSFSLPNPEFLLIHLENLLKIHLEVKIVIVPSKGEIG